MVGFVTEIDDEEPCTTSATPAEKSTSKCEEKTEQKAEKRLKGLKRLALWSLERTANTANLDLQRKYLSLLWRAAISGRNKRMTEQATTLETKVNSSILSSYYNRLSSLLSSRLSWAEEMKEAGNTLFKQQNYSEAYDKYSEALQTAPKSAAEERSRYYCNRAACSTHSEDWRAVEKDCTEALQLTPKYEKALLRRLKACELLGGDDLYKALEDAEALAEIHPRNSTYSQAVSRLKPIVEARKKEQMAEAMDSLKGIGNSVLGYFGMSLDNFKTTQNPDGTYGISYQP
eukprot:TRINITY_DN2802_c1_g1_i1.p1 TRINITY_DN2802_c1_g1~~TRINITY_DN2802_c1_g1_i1.p1  ORF type:complete len:314 (+),score=70.57 TRINITY_DN2802_c1_g1_i1:80-943(+)